MPKASNIVDYKLKYAIYHNKMILKIKINTNDKLQYNRFYSKYVKSKKFKVFYKIDFINKYYVGDINSEIIENHTQFELSATLINYLNNYISVEKINNTPQPKFIETLKVFKFDNCFIYEIKNKEEVKFYDNRYKKTTMKRDDLLSLLSLDGVKQINTVYYYGPTLSSHNFNIYNNAKDNIPASVLTHIEDLYMLKYYKYEDKFVMAFGDDIKHIKVLLVDNNYYKTPLYKFIKDYIEKYDYKMVANNIFISTQNIIKFDKKDISTNPDIKKIVDNYLTVSNNTKLFVENSNELLKNLDNSMKIKIRLAKPTPEPVADKTTSAPEPVTDKVALTPEPVVYKVDNYESDTEINELSLIKTEFQNQRTINIVEIKYFVSETEKFVIVPDKTYYHIRTKYDDYFRIIDSANLIKRYLTPSGYTMYRKNVYKINIDAKDSFENFLFKGNIINMTEFLNLIN